MRLYRYVLVLAAMACAGPTPEIEVKKQQVEELVAAADAEIASAGVDRLIRQVVSDTVYMFVDRPVVRTDTLTVVDTVRVASIIRDTIPRYRRVPPDTVRASLMPLVRERGTFSVTQHEPIPKRSHRWCLSAAIGIGINTRDRLGVFIGPALTRTLTCW